MQWGRTFLLQPNWGLFYCNLTGTSLLIQQVLSPLSGETFRRRFPPGLDTGVVPALEDIRNGIETDDVASARPEEAGARRGLAGMAYVFKIAGAAAAAGNASHGAGRAPRRRAARHGAGHAEKLEAHRHEMLPDRVEPRGRQQVMQIGDASTSCSACASRSAAIQSGSLSPSAMTSTSDGPAIESMPTRPNTCRFAAAT